MLLLLNQSYLDDNNNNDVCVHVFDVDMYVFDVDMNMFAVVMYVCLMFMDSESIHRFFGNLFFG